MLAIMQLLHWLKNDIQTQTHNGVKTMLGLHFVSKGILSQDDGKIFSTLFENDYDDFVYCDEEMVNSLTPKAEAFVKNVRATL